MKTPVIRFALLAVAVWAWLAATTVPLPSQGAPAARWWKGNLHTHTLNSDGDSSPLDVATWYREHRYHFLVLSDHNYLTDPEPLNQVLGAKNQFLLIPGEEVTDRFQDKPVHVNAYDLARLLLPTGGDSVTDTLQKNVNRIRDAGAIASLNHPNFGWAITSKELKAVDNLQMIEVYNGHPMVNNDGGGGFESLDEMWDAALSAGKRLLGVAVDDAHNFKRFGREFSNPGHGWVVVRAAEHSREAIMEGLRKGDFYASTGVELSDVKVTEKSYELTIKPDQYSRYTTYFVGAEGKILARSFGLNPKYDFQGKESYVRARVESSSGWKAWCQPVFRGN